MFSAKFVFLHNLTRRRIMHETNRFWSNTSLRALVACRSDLCCLTWMAWALGAHCSLGLLPPLRFFFSSPDRTSTHVLPRRKRRPPSRSGFRAGRYVQPAGPEAAALRARRLASLEGSFSAVSKQKFASKCAFESSRRDLHNALLCTTLKSHFIKNKLEFCRNLRNFLELFLTLLNFTKICKNFGKILIKN